jgi:hypothetical protein
MMRKLALYTAVGLATAGTIGAVSLTKAHAGVAADAPSSIVEDYAYPNPDPTLEALGVHLISGDGHIMLVTCSTDTENNVGTIDVHTATAGVGTLCFKVHGTTGLLNLVVPSIFEIRGDGHAPGAGHDITATVDTADAPPRDITVNPDGSTPVGIGDPNDNRDTTLLQLKVTG